MRTKTLGLAVAATLGLAACGGGSGSGSAGSASSGLNPFGWFSGGSTEPKTLTPEGGYPTTTNDNRQPVARILGAKWEPLYEGGLITVTALPATKGWWALKLIPEVPQPEGRLTPDMDGVLRLRLVGLPPLANTLDGASPAVPPTDTATVGITISNEGMVGLRQVVISGATNSVTLRAR